MNENLCVDLLCGCYTSAELSPCSIYAYNNGDPQIIYKASCGSGVKKRVVSVQKILRALFRRNPQTGKL